MQQKTYSYTQLLPYGLLGTLVATLIFNGILFVRVFYGQEALFFADSGLPMLLEADSYFFLNQAQQYLATGASVQALSMLLAKFHQFTGFPLEQIGFYLPLFFNFFTALALVGWAWLADCKPTNTAAFTFIAFSIPTFFARTSFGWLDTDPGIAMCWTAALLGTTMFSLSRLHLATRLGGLALMLASSFLLAWWWLPGVALLPGCLLLWGLSFYSCTNKIEAGVRLFVAVIIIAGGLLFLLLPSLPTSLESLRAWTIGHLHLVLGTAEGLVYSSIKELIHTPWNEYFSNIGGFSLLGLAMFLTLPLLYIRQPQICFFLLPPMACLVLGWFIPRFLYFGTFCLALACATLPNNLRHHASAITITRHPALAWALCAVLTISFVWHSSTQKDQTIFKQGHDAIAVQLRQAGPPQAPVWLWWDDGYFIQNRAGKTPFFDGGSQSPYAAWIAAHPLAMNNPEHSRRWIRFFSLRGSHALQPLIAAVGEEKAWLMLDELFAHPRPLELIPALPAMSGITTSPQEWFFPHGQVFLYLSQRFMNLAPWWMTMGMYRNSTREQMRTDITTIKKTNLEFDEQNMIVTLKTEKGQQRVPIKQHFATDKLPLDEPWMNPENTTMLIQHKDSDYAYLVNRQGAASVALRLMAPSGEKLPGFKSIAQDYKYAGAWEVLPDAWVVDLAGY